MSIKNSLLCIHHQTKTQSPPPPPPLQKKLSALLPYLFDNRLGCLGHCEVLWNVSPDCRENDIPTIVAMNPSRKTVWLRANKIQ